MLPGKNFSKEKIAVLLFRLLLVLVLVEIGLRISGYTYVALQDIQNRWSTENDAYRILVLGDSMTVYGGSTSWPRQLENLLNNRSTEKKFRVLVKAHGAQTSSGVLSGLEDSLDKFQPDMVMAMIGKNDQEPLISTGNLPPPLSDLRVLKFGSHLLSLAQHQKDSVLQPIYFIMGEQFLKNGDVNKAERMFKKVFKKNISNELVTIQLITLYLDREGPPDSSEIFKDLTELGATSQDALVELSRVMLYLNRSEEAEQLFNIIRRLSLAQLNEAYGSLGNWYRVKNRPEEAEEFFARMKELRIQYFNPATRSNYNNLYKTVYGHGARFVMVQYPTKRISELKNKFQGDEDILFVDNEKNFEDALQTYTYDELFMDTTGGSFGRFGHGTQKGNWLIADSTAETVLAELQE